MARRHGDRSMLWSRRRLCVGMEPLEGRRLLSLPPGADSILGIPVSAGFVSKSDPAETAETPNSSGPPVAPGISDLQTAAPRVLAARIMLEPVQTPMAPPMELDVAWIDAHETTAAVDLAAPQAAIDLVGAAVYRGGSTAEPPTRMPGLGSSTHVENAKDGLLAQRLPVFSATDLGPLAEFEQRFADDEAARSAAMLPPPTALPIGDADRPASFFDDGMRPPMNNPDVAWQLQSRGTGTVVLTTGNAAVAAVANSGIAIDREAPSEPLAGEAKESGNRATTETDNAVGYLVAFEAGVKMGTTDAAQSLVYQGSAAVKSILNDLLVPKLALDEAVVGIAIRELFADAEQVGVRLFGMFADPVQSAQLVAGTGVIAAGLAVRQLRKRESREREEARRMLAARFIAGPESVRLFRPRGLPNEF